MTTDMDRLDEVWEGVRHLVPFRTGEHAHVVQQLAESLGPVARAAGLVPVLGAFNVGISEHDFRVPDGGIHRTRPTGLWNPTAALLFEVVTLGDGSWEKLSFYAAHHVDEVLIVDPLKRSVDWLGRDGAAYKPIERSALIDLGAAELAARIDWP